VSVFYLPWYRPTRVFAVRQVLTEAGELLTGLKVYESVDGVTLMTADAKTVRINADAIVQQQFMALSLMHEGQLDGLSQQQVADLLAYLRGL
jgi:putative heme-binding domain-containing protein